MSTRSGSRGRPASLPPTALWSSPAVAAAAAMVGAGVVLVVAGASRVSSEVVYDDQVAGINLAIAGAVLANVAAAWFLLSGRRAVVNRRLAVLGPVPQLIGAGVGAGSAYRVDAPSDVVDRLAGDVLTGDVLAGDVFVGVEGLRHFHRGSCALAADRDWTARSRAEHEQAGRTPCGVCLP